MRITFSFCAYNRRKYSRPSEFVESRIAYRGKYKPCCFRNKIIDRGEPSLLVNRLSQSRSQSGSLILLLLIILRQAFLEVLGAKGIQRRMIACPTCRREMRTTSQALAATGSPQVRPDDGAVVAEAVSCNGIYIRDAHFIFFLLNFEAVYLYSIIILPYNVNMYTFDTPIVK